MASPGDLVAVVAKSLGLPPVTVGQHDRNLAEAGLRTKGGRGLSAAKMTAEDAARLLIATVSSMAVKDTVQVFELYSQLPSRFGEDDQRDNSLTTWKLTAFPIVELQCLPCGHTFVEALAALIKAASRDTFAQTFVEGSKSIFKTNIIIEVEFIAPDPMAKITINGVSDRVSFGETRSYCQEFDPIDSQSGFEGYFKKLDRLGDLHQHRFFTLKTLDAVGKLLREG